VLRAADASRLPWAASPSGGDPGGCRPQPQRDNSEYVVLPLPASPRHELEVRQRLGEPEPAPADVNPRPAEPLDQFKAFLRYTEARLPADASPAVLLAAIDQTKLLLARLTKLLRQSGDDQSGKVVVNLR
jgi:hypothetical protein